jgi:hypothetical protein
MDHTPNDPVTNALMGCPPENYILIAYKRGCEDTSQKLQKHIEQLEAALKFLIRCEEVTEAAAKSAGQPYVNKGLDFARMLLGMEKKDD